MKNFRQPFRFTAFATVFHPGKGAPFGALRALATAQDCSLAVLRNGRGKFG